MDKTKFQRDTCKTVVKGRRGDFIIYPEFPLYFNFSLQRLLKKKIPDFVNVERENTLGKLKYWSLIVGVKRFSCVIAGKQIVC